MKLHTLVKLSVLCTLLFALHSDNLFIIGQCISILEDVMDELRKVTDLNIDFFM